MTSVVTMETGCGIEIISRDNDYIVDENDTLYSKMSN